MQWIQYDSQSGLFVLRTKDTMYQMKTGRFGYLLHLYYGRDMGPMDMEYRIVGLDRGFSPNPADAGEDRTFSLDVLPQEFSGSGNGDYRICPAKAVMKDGSDCLDFRYESHRILPGKYSLPSLPALFGSEEEACTLEITLCDRVSGLKAVLLYGVFPERNIITRAVRFVNGGQEALTLEKAMSMQLDFLESDLELVHFHGRHTMERIPERLPLMHGHISVESTRGASSHQHNPFVILCSKDAGETAGECWGAMLAYSGSFLMETEVDQYGQTRLAAGIHPDQFAWNLEPGESFFTPEVILTYSDSGFGKMSRQLHDVLRFHMIRSPYAHSPRPILVNSWEAAYFKFDEKILLDIARNAKEVGLDLFVLDDGWFGKRNDDNCALGDWYVNEDKIKGGLKALSDEVRAMGLKLGLWIEPEMVSEDSDLYRAHPDWCLKYPGRAPFRGRDQLNLDITRPEVRGAVMDQIISVIKECGISYIKWDFNRNVGNVYSAAAAGSQKEIPHRYVLALYEMQERLITECPDLLFENCAGGGGRFDAGMLYYSPQIWCSDNTDPIDRLSIQYGTSFAYPPSTMGAHVSVSPNHQTGRATPFSSRGLVAQCGTFGFEMDLGRLTEVQKEETRRMIDQYRQDEPLIQGGDYYRLSDAAMDRDQVFWQFVSKDRKESLVQGIMLRPKSNGPISYIKLQGLKEDSLYHDVEMGGTYTGAALMYAGIPLPLPWGNYQPVRMHLVETTDRRTS